MDLHSAKFSCNGERFPPMDNGFCCWIKHHVMGKSLCLLEDNMAISSPLRFKSLLSGHENHWLD